MKVIKRKNLCQKDNWGIL